MKKSHIFLMLLVCLQSLLNAQLVVDNAVNANEAVQDILLGPGVTASNITFQGNNAQIGGFTCNNCGLGIGNGVVIGTGNVDGAEGPNNVGDFFQGPPNNADGMDDGDLEDLSGMALNNTAVLEFDFVPTGDSLAFNYVFSSEEYPEFLTGFNDAFGFFLSGPGLNGSYSNNAMNIAILPGTNVPIGISNVNPNVNSAYYVSNAGNAANIQADGMTVVLTAYADVICGETYHIKMAIGDAVDERWDSWVYLQAGSFQSNQLALSYTAPAYSSGADGGVYEGCQAGNLLFTRTGTLAEEQSYNLTFGGNAIIGTDIDFPYTEILFPVDEDSVLLTFQAIQDFLTEGQESLVITMENIGCLTTSAEVTVNVYDLPVLQVSVADALINCGETVTYTPVVTGGVGDYLISWPGGFEGPSYQVSPSAATTYPFTVSDTCGVIPFTGSVDVDFIVNPPLTVEVSNDLTATCLDVQDFQPLIAGGLPPYDLVWFVNGIQESTTANLTFQSDITVALEFEVTDVCGITVSDAFDYAVPPVPITLDLGSDLTLQCIDEVIFDLVPVGGVGTYQIEWFVDGAFQSSGPAFNDFFDADVLLEVEVFDQCGNTVVDEVTIAIPAVTVEVALPDDIYSDCLTTQLIEPIVSGGAGLLSFSWFENEAALSAAAYIDYNTNINSVLSLTVSDQCGNSGSDNMHVFIPPSPIAINASPDTVICLYDGALLSADAEGGVGELTFRWDSGSASNNQFVAPTVPTIYSLQVEDECGNVSSVDISVGIDFIEPNFSAAYVSDDVVKLTNLLPDSMMTFWEFSDGSVSNDFNTEHRFNTLDEWVATLHAYTALGCHGELSQTFQPTGDFFVPSCFTPNFDGINDVWRPVGRDLLTYEVKIFNRYGQVVFETTDMNESWTGGVMGSNYFAPNGLYSFTLRATDNRFNTIERSGYLQITR